VTRLSVISRTPENVMTKAALRLSLGLFVCALGNTGFAQDCRDDVRATAPTSRYVDNGDSTVTDLATGLMWQRCTEGLFGANCESGTATNFVNWQDALEFAAGSAFAGYGDWRLPNRRELTSLVEHRCFRPAINAGVFPNTPDYDVGFWSSTPTTGFELAAWVVSFARGDDHPLSKYKGNALVRLVRDGQ